MALLVGKGFAAGAAFATVTNVAQQIDANLKNGDTWYRIDVGQTLNAAVQGGIYGAVTAGIAGPVLSGAAIQYASFCKVVTPIAKFAMRAGGAKAMIDGGVMVYNGDVVSGLLNITVGALSFRAASKFSACFTAGHQILAKPIGMTVADTSANMSDETRGWRTEYLVGAGVAIAVGAAASAHERRKRRRLLAEARDYVYGCQWESNARHDLDDDDDPLREAIAMDHAEAAIWSDESFLPDADGFDEPATAFVGSDAEQTCGIACLPPPQAAQLSHAPRHKPIHGPQSKGAGRAVERISSRLASGSAFHSSLLSSASSRPYPAGLAPTA